MCLFYNSRSDSEDSWRACENTAGSHPQVSDSLGLEWNPGICIFNKFPDDNETAGLGPHSELLAYGKNIAYES